MTVGVRVGVEVAPGGDVGVWVGVFVGVGVGVEVAPGGGVGVRVAVGVGVAETAGVAVGVAGTVVGVAGTVGVVVCVIVGVGVGATGSVGDLSSQASANSTATNTVPAATTRACFKMPSPGRCEFSPGTFIGGNSTFYRES